MTNGERLLHDVQVYGFAMGELILYLDTNPDDENALRAYDMFSQKYATAVAEYSRDYGALSGGSVNTSKGWSWVDDPWPWH